MYKKVFINPSQKTQKNEFFIKPGMLVLGKSERNTFYKKEEVKKKQKELIKLGYDSNNSNTKLQYKHYCLLPSVKYFNKIGLLTTITLSKEIITSKFGIKKISRYYDFEILHDSKLYITFDVAATSLIQRFDFIQPPFRINKSETFDDNEFCLNGIFENQFSLLRAKKSFYAYRGDSYSYDAVEADDNKRNKKKKSLFYINKGDTCVFMEARRTLNRDKIIVDFFVNSVLCWVEFKETSLNKARERFGRDFDVID